jgi:hypothetical protein
MIFLPGFRIWIDFSLKCGTDILPIGFIWRARFPIANAKIEEDGVDWGGKTSLCKRESWRGRAYDEGTMIGGIGLLYQREQ